MSRSTATDLLWIALWFALLILAGYGLRDPWPADEPRFASIARDMVATGEWLIPRAGGDLYQDKPPLHFWMMAAAYSVIGSLRWAFLLPSMLASLGTLLLVYDVAKRLHGRDAGLLAAITLACTLHFTITTRGAQIDATLIFFCTLALWAFLRHWLIAPSFGLVIVGGLAAGLGVMDKAVGFLTLLIWPLAWWLLRKPAVFTTSSSGERSPAHWGYGLVALTSFVLVLAAWLVPMLLHVANSGSAELASYRDELLFQQTVTRYTAAWHHLRPWYYFLVEVVPVLWLPFSLLLWWLVPRWRADTAERRVETVLPLLWAVVVIVFFSLSPGKRGVYILPALPALALAASAHLPNLYRRLGVQRASLGLAAVLVIPALLLVLGRLVGIDRIDRIWEDIELQHTWPVFSFALCSVLLWSLAKWRKPLLAWPLVLACLTVHWGLAIAPQINSERSASGFMRSMLAQVPAGRELGLVGYKEQFLLYLDREITNFGHARWREGNAEAEDAARWLAGDPQNRILLVPEHLLAPCFEGNARKVAGESSDDLWWLVVGLPQRECIARGNPSKVIRYRP
ncbi:MAG: ArnT family glycosyltransferase [Steroidobacteraceae bacterium]